MSYCKTCEHWQPTHKDAYFPYGVCEHLRIASDSFDIDCDSREGARHHIHTKPDFGCVEHQEKSP